MERYVLCIDNGLTTTKSVIFTLDGKEVASSVTNTVVENSNECAEIDMELQWINTAKVIKESIFKSGINPKTIIGVGNSGHGAGLYCLDKYDKPVRKAISSMDARTCKILEQWLSEGKSSFERLYQNQWSGQAIPILNWLKQNEPESYEKIDKILMVKDWIIFKLTGKAGLEYTDASNSGILNPISKRIDQEILELFDVKETYEKFPPLRKSTDISGTITKTAAEETGLSEGTPVIGGVYDVVACALGSGVYDNNKYSLIAGTWNINAGIEDTLIHSHDTIKCTLFVDINKYIYVESSATSAVNLEWFVDNIIKGFGINTLTNKQLYKRIDKEIEKIKTEDTNIIYTPFLYKSHLVKSLEGTFFGIKAEYNIFHMLRAVFEGVVFAHFMHLENLKAAGIVRDSAVLSGGASNSEIWSQMFADVLNREITTTKTSQVGALGVAVCIGVALGEYEGFKEAISVMVKDNKHYYPDIKQHESYMKKYYAFQTLINKFSKDN